MKRKKLILHSQALKQMLPLAMLILIGCVIWFFSPYVAINGHVYLQTPLSRLTVIFLMTLSWGIYHFIQQYKQSFIVNSKDSHQPQAKQSFLTTLEQHIRAIMALPSHHGITPFLHWLWPSQKSIHLLIGTQNSGKSRLCQRCEWPFAVIPKPTPAKETLIHQHKDKPDEKPDKTEIPETTTSFCHWYVDDRTVFLDTPGEYATSEVNTTKETPWKTLLSTLVAHKKHLKLASIILTINIAELASQSKPQAKLHIHLLKQRLLEIQATFHRPIPLTIVFTKCDLISGFCEYFDKHHQQQRQGLFGLSFEKEDYQHHFIDTFKKDYDVFIQQLHSHVIHYLHQEHNPQKRNRIRDFPLQFEALKPLVTTVVQQTAAKTNACGASLPQGIYFTSSEQAGEPVELLHEKIHQTFHLTKLPIHETHKMISKPFFIHQLFKTIANASHGTPWNHQPKLPLTWQRRLIYTTGGLCIIAFGLVIAAHFKNNLLTLNQVQRSLYTFQMLSQNTHNPEAEQQAKNNLVSRYHKATRFWIFNQRFNEQQPTSVKQLLQKDPLLTHLTSGLNQLITQQLKNTKTPPNVLYNDLKIYLMLGYPRLMHKSFLLAWLHQQQKPHFFNDTDTKLLWANILSQKLAPMATNDHLIALTRQKLKSLPKAYLAFLILQSKVLVNHQPPLRFSIQNQTLQIPYFYTAKGLQTWFLNNYKEAVKESMSGNTTLGFSHQNHPMAKQADAIEKNLIGIYIKNYATWWTSKFYRLSLTQPIDLTQAATIAKNIADPQQGLVSVLQTFRRNTQPTILLPTSVNTPDINFIRETLHQQFKDHLNGLKQINVEALQNALNQLNRIMRVFAEPNHLNRNAFILAKEEFTQTHQQTILTGFWQYIHGLPEPFHQWFQTYCQQTWTLILKGTQDYINGQWQKKIVPYYQQQLLSRYPIFNDGTKDVALPVFTHFFAPQGLLNRFFNDYLAPFINTHHNTWFWKTTHHQTLTFNETIFKIFERGRIITAMFFPGHDANMNVHFHLQQIALMPIVKKIQLSINGQDLRDQQGSKNISTFVWPGNSNNLGTRILLTQLNGQRLITSDHGPWAWFHLLNHSVVQTTDDPRIYRITFNVDGAAAKYKLTAAEEINPFIPGIIDTFRIPNQLG